jgi:hypothetical protein
MLVSLELLDNVSGHQGVKGALVVIPIQFDAALKIAGPILGGFIFCFDRCNEVINVSLALILHAEIVNIGGEGDGSSGVFPKTGGIFTLMITVQCKAFA